MIHNDVNSKFWAIKMIERCLVCIALRWTNFDGIRHATHAPNGVIKIELSRFGQ